MTTFHPHHRDLVVCLLRREQSLAQSSLRYDLFSWSGLFVYMTDVNICFVPFNLLVLAPLMHFFVAYHTWHRHTNLPLRLGINLKAAWGEVYLDFGFCAESFFFFLKTDRRTGKKIRAASWQKAALWCKSHFQTFIGVCCRLFWLCQPLLCVSSSFEDWERSEHTPFRVKWKIPICPVLCISLTVRSCCLPNHRSWNWSPLVWITGWQCWAKMEGKMEEGKDERRTVAPCTYSTVCSQQARCECWQATISSLKQRYGEKLL